MMVETSNLFEMGKHKFDKSFNKEYFIDRVIFLFSFQIITILHVNLLNLERFDNIAKTLRVQQNPLVLVKNKTLLAQNCNKLL